ncbi:class I SAM-dependent methyltransferase [Candidatus Pelagibacter bacterium]|nr:class I SAM-dependent methyltransferase [Candidatus Pelagibacter bacterium]
MKRLRNWDNETWLSSEKYISAFNIFLRSKIKFNKETFILDMGCGRANIISSLQKKYKFENKPIGIDVVRNKNIKKNIIFNKIDGISFLRKTNKKFDLILIKQTIHFLNKNQIKSLLTNAKSKLNTGGKLLIFSLKTNNNQIPCFKKMKLKLKKSLKKDEMLFKTVKNKLLNSKESYFNFKVNITKQKYIEMIKNRYISCLLNMSLGDLTIGINELNSKYKNYIKFNDTLKCIYYKKN